MSKIYIKFKHHPELELDIDNSEPGQKWIALLKQNLVNGLPVYRDRVRYTVECMFELAKQTRPDVKPMSVDDYTNATGIKIPKDYA